MREKTAGSELALRGGCDRDRVDSLEVSTGHNNSVYIMTRGHNPMDTEPDKEIAPGEASRTERLLESLSRVESFGQFWQTIRGCEDEVVEDAIVMQDTHWRRKTLEAWFEGDTAATLPNTNKTSIINYC